MPINLQTLKQCIANSKRIHALLPDIENMEVGTATRLKADEFMDLVIEVLHRTDKEIDISLTHYYEQNGDLIPDPDMRVRLILKDAIAYPMHIQMPLYYREAMDIDGNCYPREIKDQSSFLSQWLRNIKAQGHAVVSEKKAA